MADSGWGVRLFVTGEYGDEGTIDFFSNFKKGKSRQQDTIITFSGMYGVDNYLIWNMHKDLPNYDFSTTALDVNIFMYKSTDIVCFQDFYRVQDIRYNTVKSQYTIYAISETTVKLRSKLVGYNVTSLTYSENRTAKDIFTDVLQKNDIFYVVFHEDNDATKTMLHYEYRYFAIDPEWTVLDFIEYICDENQYEWTIDTFVDEATNEPYYIFHFGHELMADKDMEASKALSIEIDNISQSLYAMKITTNSSPMQPMANWEDTHKCVWAKHTAGKGGGMSKGCFVPVGLGHFNKHLYLRSLEGEIEKTLGSAILSRRKVRIPSIGIGNVLVDEGVFKDDSGNTTGVSPYIDSISIQKNPDTYTIREPHNIIVNRGSHVAVQHQIERATRWSPYIDNKAGLQYPSPKLQDDNGDVHPPNSLMFYVDGKRESAVMGGYVFGGGAGDWADYEIPIKEREDFRLKFPDGGEIYYEAEHGKWHFNAPGGLTFKDNVVNHDELPVQGITVGSHGDDYNRDPFSALRMTMHDGGFQIEGKIPLLVLEPGGCFRIAPYFNETADGAGRYIIRAYNDLGEIHLYSDNKIKIKTSKASAEIAIETGDGEGGLQSGTITINTTGTINIGAGATAINLAGGANALSHASHTHQIPPGPAIPGPPVNTSTHLPAQGTTKTKAD